MQARGLTSYEVEYERVVNAEPDGDDIEIDSNKITLTELLNYIQNQGKKWRSGVRYTELVLDKLSKFKHPKIWSSTRISVY